MSTLKITRGKWDWVMTPDDRLEITVDDKPLHPTLADARLICAAPAMYDFICSWGIGDKEIRDVILGIEGKHSDTQRIYRTFYPDIGACPKCGSENYDVLFAPHKIVCRDCDFAMRTEPVPVKLKRFYDLIRDWNNYKKVEEND